jgi:hypothetical protein
MGKMKRDEYLKWCKSRALEYVNTGNGMSAMTSMISDLGKNPEFAPSAELGSLLMFATDPKDLEAVRRFVEGFN